MTDKMEFITKKCLFLSLMLIIALHSVQAAVNVNSATTIHISAGISLYSEGGITVEQGGSIDNSGMIILTGDWINNGNGLVNGGPGKVVFGGSGMQTIGGDSATIFNDLEINNGAGINNNVVLADHNIAVNGTLSFLNGNIVTAGRKVIAGSAATISGASMTSGWVNGSLEKDYSTNTGIQTFQYAIGDDAVYAPCTLAMKNVDVTAGAVNIFAHISTSDSNEIYVSGIDQSKKSDHYWFLDENSNAGSFDSYDITLDFTNTGKAGTIANYVLRQFHNGTWTFANAIVIGTTIKANGLTSFGDYEVGESILTAVKEQASSLIRLWPNPVRDNVYVFIPELSVNAHIYIYDALGQLLYHSDLVELKSVINLEQLAQGIYFAKVQTGTTEWLQKFVKNN
jgi:hypothetical protein